MKEDKRRARRFVFLLDVDVRRFEENDYTKAQLIDISRYGVKLLLGKKIAEAGGQIEIRIQLPKQAAPSYLRGTVIRCEGRADEWVAGITLDSNESNAQNKDRILDYAYQIWIDKTKTKI